LFSFQFVVEGKLKNIGLFLILFFVLVSNTFSQTVSQDDNAAARVQIDERALVFGGGEEVAVDASPSGVSSFWVIFRLIVVLALVAAAIYGIVFFLKKISKPTIQQDPVLKVLAGTPLGANRFVHVVGVGSKAWLVGATDGGVSLIAEITDQETIDAMLLEDSKRGAEAAKASGFASLLRRAASGQAAPDGPKAENVRKSRERLRGLQ
jgi:flagellar protein FliO/FliZ